MVRGWVGQRGWAVGQHRHRDLIVCTRNDHAVEAGEPGRMLANGDLLRIEAITGDRLLVRRALDADSATGRRRWTDRQFLFARYQDSELGYAVTDHTAQGRTVHTGPCATRTRSRPPRRPGGPAMNSARPAPEPGTPAWPPSAPPPRKMQPPGKAVAAKPPGNATWPPAIRPCTNLPATRGRLRRRHGRPRRRGRGHPPATPARDSRRH